MDEVEAPQSLPGQVGLLRRLTMSRGPDRISGEPGSVVAGHECGRAITAYLGGRGVSLILPDEAMTAAHSDLAVFEAVEGLPAAPVRLLPTSKLPDALRDDDIAVLHDLYSPRFDLAAYARAAFSDHVLPATCIQYGFSIQQFLADIAPHLLLPVTYPCDSVVCATHVARKTMERMVDRIHETISSGGALAQPRSFRFDVIPYGVPVDVFKPRERGEIRRRLELPSGRILLLFSGRIDPSTKADPIPLLLAFHDLVKKHGEHIALVLIGPTQAQFATHLKTWIDRLGLSRSVIHRTNVPQINVPLYYSAADIFISLSDTMQENFGLVPVEAMASGLPVVVSDWGGYQETVLHGVTGFRVPTHWIGCDQDICALAPFHEWSIDHLSMAQSVVADMERTVYYLDLLISHEEQRLEMGLAARRHVETQYSWECVIGQYRELWLELCGIAQTLTLKQDVAGLLLRPQYFKDFRNFASDCISDTMSLGLTDRGRLLLEQNVALPLYQDSRQLLKPEVLHDVLRILKKCGRMSHLITLGSLVETLHTKHALPVPAVRRHLMWLLKYDYLRLLNK